MPGNSGIWKLKRKEQTYVCCCCWCIDSKKLDIKIEFSLEEILRWTWKTRQKPHLKQNWKESMMRKKSRTRKHRESFTLVLASSLILITLSKAFFTKHTFRGATALLVKEVRFPIDVWLLFCYVIEISKKLEKKEDCSGVDM